MSGYLVAVTEHFGSASPQSLTSFRVRMCDFGFVFMPSVSPRVPSQPSDVICNRDLRWSSLSRTHTISYHTHPNTGKRTGLVAKIHLLYAQQKVTMMRGQGHAQKMSNDIQIMKNDFGSFKLPFSNEHPLQFQHEDTSPGS